MGMIEGDLISPVLASRAFSPGREVLRLRREGCSLSFDRDMTLIDNL